MTNLLPIAVETISFRILHFATVFSRIPFLTDHISTKYNIISSKKYDIIAFQTCPPSPSLFQRPLMSRDYYVPLHYTGYNYHLHNCWKTHLLNTVWKIFTEYFDKILRAYALYKTHLIFILQITEQPHHTQTNGAAGLHSVWHERRVIFPHRGSGGFSKTFKIAIWF